MKFKELDAVVVLFDIPTEKITAGMTGTVVITFDNYPDYYLVEFVNKNGETIILTEIHEDYLEAYQPNSLSTKKVA